MVPFLLNCTDPFVGSVNELLAEEPERGGEEPTVLALSALSALSLPTPVGVSDAYTIDPRLLFTGLVGPYLDTSEYDSHYNEPPWDIPVLESLTVVDGLAGRVNLLLSELVRLDIRPHLAQGIDRFALQAFFTSANCQKFVSAFYRRRHYHSPLIHWPTLDLETVALPLLLALLLTGAAYSHWRETNSGDVGFAKGLHALADKYIFNSLKQRTETDTASNHRQETLEILQAAYMINYLHISMNDVGARRGVMTKRHPMLVASVKERGLTSSRHTAGEDRDDFIYQESCIRLVTWTFLTDALLTLFANKPPLMLLHEISSHMPCREEFWDMEYVSDSDMQLVIEELCWGGFGLKSIISELLSDQEWTEGTETSLRLNVRHLHAAIFGK